MADDAQPGASSHRRRHRHRSASADAPLPGPPPGAAPPVPPPAPQRGRPNPPRETGERGLRDLVGAGRSQLGVEGALRGRDVNRPTADDLAEAEENLVIVRRHWTPPAHDQR